MNTLFQYSDTLRSFDINIGSRKCTYTGSERKLKFIEYLCDTLDKQIDEHYRQLFDTVDLYKWSNRNCFCHVQGRILWYDAYSPSSLSDISDMNRRHQDRNNQISSSFRYITRALYTETHPHRRNHARQKVI